MSQSSCFLARVARRGENLAARAPSSARRFCWGLWQRRRRRARRGVQQAALHGEVLEDRSLLSGNPLAELAGLGRLAVDPQSYDPSAILVRFRAEDARGTDTGRAWPLVRGLQRVGLAQGVSLEAALAAYRADPRVLYAEPDYRVQMTLAPNDPQFVSQWALDNTGQTGGTPDADIDAPGAWNVTTGTSSTIVAVIDTGVDYNHPDLAANMWVNAREIAGNGVDDDENGFVDDVRGWNFVRNTNDPMDDQGHGTHVAGTIGAVGDNGVGVAGVNWNVRIMAVKFLDSSGSGTSMAAPHVAGVAAMVRGLHSDWTHRQVIDQVLNSVDYVPALEGRTAASGRLNAARAVGVLDTQGPRVLGSVPSGGVGGVVSSIRLTFQESIAAASFGLEDIASFQGPQGPISVTAVNAVPGSFNRKFDVTFAPQAAYGAYAMVVGPAINTPPPSASANSPRSHRTTFPSRWPR